MLSFSDSMAKRLSALHGDPGNRLIGDFAIYCYSTNELIVIDVFNQFATCY